MLVILTVSFFSIIHLYNQIKEQGVLKNYVYEYKFACEKYRYSDHETIQSLIPHSCEELLGEELSKASEALNRTNSLQVAMLNVAFELTWLTDPLPMNIELNDSMFIKWGEYRCELLEAEYLKFLPEKLTSTNKTSPNNAEYLYFLAQSDVFNCSFINS
ncbi:hypothetical protein A1QO_04230 [Vibrio genomosp. F10 str. ZF-129]|uniref:Uncharacterized protein n=1 Tax=Vibrio genomosp. F10 str. ZF-129 TaxID=1187848 RepID=A0A1E5BIU4_9VIBR|nr:hypothetical protein A1QO_04230 [Vibrio genomosp. F10 str. ZF-129]